MRRQESDEPELGRCEPVVLSSPDPPFETRQPGRKRSAIGISLERVARNLREFQGAGKVAEIEADVGAAQREIGVEPRGPAEQCRRSRRTFSSSRAASEWSPRCWCASAPAV